MGLLDIRDDPNYVNANEATKRAIFEQYSVDDPDYANANEATKAAIRREFGISTQAVAPTEVPVEASAVAPQALGVAREVVSNAPQIASSGLDMAKRGAQAVGNMTWQQGARAVADVGSMMAGHPPYATMFKMATDTATGTPIKEVVGNTVNAVKGGAGALASGARNVGGALLRGAMAPESAFLMPYQMAAYEQEKIRANPNAPGLENNPYAQMYRGEYATQGQAGAANARRAVVNAPYGNVTPEEKAILDEDKKRKMQMMMQYEAARRVLGQK